MSVTPYYNAPADKRDLAASFGSLADAQAYADEYGGEVEASGTAFSVRGADHEKAQDDMRSAQAGKGAGLWKGKSVAKPEAVADAKADAAADAKGGK